MKKIRHLSLGSRQLLTLDEQEKIVAGYKRTLVASYGTTTCSCTAKGQSHGTSNVYWCTTDYAGVLLGYAEMGLGILEIGVSILGEAPSAGASTLGVLSGVYTCGSGVYTLGEASTYDHYESDVTKSTCIQVTPTIGHSVSSSTQMGIVNNP